jgi:glycosyltransferase involved in cell wall biosynthesis
VRVAIVHHWFVTRGGGERVAECIAALFPRAEIFTLLAAPRGIPATFAHRTLHTSILQRVPLAASYHRHMMPLYPLATESLDLRGFDLVISSDSGPIKGVRLDPGAIHICYCHSPMRYLYDGYEAYRANMKGITRTLFTASASRLRRWDIRAATRVTHFIANSRYVAARIERFYHREATVIHPPIDLHRAVIQPSQSLGQHYLAAGRLVSYKHTEIMIEACRRLNRDLRIAGTGPELPRLRQLAGPSVTFLGELPTPDLWREYSLCRALLFAADEDFGMVPLEAQACGRPVIAFGAGGSLETVRANSPEGPATGLYFPHQIPESLAEAILRFEAEESREAFNPNETHRWAETFATPIFLHTLRAYILERIPAAASEMASEVELASLWAQEGS